MNDRGACIAGVVDLELDPDGVEEVEADQGVLFDEFFAATFFAATAAADPGTSVPPPLRAGNLSRAGWMGREVAEEEGTTSCPHVRDSLRIDEELAVDRGGGAELVEACCPFMASEGKEFCCSVVSNRFEGRFEKGSLGLVGLAKQPSIPLASPHRIDPLPDSECSQ